MNRKLFGRLTVGVICILASCSFYTGYWVVGPVFGFSFLAMNLDRLQKRSTLRYLAFLAASILTYALVYKVVDQGIRLPWGAQKGWHFKNETLDLLFGSESAGIVLGSLLMPAFHGVLLSINFRVIRKAWVILISTWYFAILFFKLYEALKLPTDIFNLSNVINVFTVGIVLWQSSYFMIFSNPAKGQNQEAA